MAPKIWITGKVFLIKFTAGSELHISGLSRFAPNFRGLEIQICWFKPSLNQIWTKIQRTNIHWVQLIEYVILFIVVTYISSKLKYAESTKDFSEINTRGPEWKIADTQTCHSLVPQHKIVFTARRILITRITQSRRAIISINSSLMRSRYD